MSAPRGLGLALSACECLRIGQSWRDIDLPDVVYADEMEPAAMAYAARHDMGLGLPLCLLADGGDRLVRLSEPMAELDTDLWILIHPGVRHVARIKNFTDLLYERLRASAKVLPN
jgi:DNA-binding transcriptional LysR family regulator